MRERIRWLLALLAGAAIGAAVASPARAQTPTTQTTPTAAEIFARAAKTIDPQGVLAKHSSSRSTSTLELVGMGVTGTSEGYAAAPARIYQKTVIGPIGTVESGFDGSVGWVINTTTGPSLMEPGQISRVKQLSAWDYWQHKPDAFRSVGTPAAVTFEGKPAYKIHLVGKDGWEYDEYFDVGSGLRRGIEYVETANGGRTPTLVVFEDYKPFAGTMVAGTITQRTPSVTIVQRTVSVEFDVAPDSVFALPPAIRALVKP